MQFREFLLEMLKGKTDVNSEVHLFQFSALANMTS